jgi:acetyl-CoA acyltransferase 1
LRPAPQNCSAGDSAAYERRNVSLDDVVIVSALRTPLTKVRRRARRHSQ